jgi:hypothetical protein
MTDDFLFLSPIAMIMNWVIAGSIAVVLGLLPGIPLPPLRLWRALLTILGAMAQNSSTFSGLRTHYHTINRQADVDELVETGCTELNGQIINNQAYSGPLMFPGLTNMTGGGIELEEGSRVTFIDFPDLKAVGQVPFSMLAVLELT